MPHRYTVKVRFYELDPYGHLNHSVYVQLFETGRIELLEEARISLQVLEDQGYRLLVSRIETSFLRPVEAGAALVIETEVAEVKRASSIWEQRLLDGNEPAAIQRVRIGVTDPNGRPVRFPAELAAALEPYQPEVDS
jgi:acyl-CoA thioester hydrolase